MENKKIANKQIAKTSKEIVRMIENDEFSVSILESYNLLLDRDNYTLEYINQHKTRENIRFVLKRIYSYITKRIILLDKPIFKFDPVLLFENTEIVSDVTIHDEKKLIKYLLELEYIKNQKYSHLPSLFARRKKRNPEEDLNAIEIVCGC